MFCEKLIPSSKLNKKLLKAVQSNDTRTIEKLVKRSSHLLTQEYHGDDYNNYNILILACSDQNFMKHVTGATITKLIDLGASCVEPTKNDHWEAIHYAAINANQEKLKAIVQRLTHEEINSLVYCSKHVPGKYGFCPNKNLIKSYSNNALSVLLKYGNRKNDFYECCELLIQKGINVNQPDSNGVTPLDMIKQINDTRLEDILKQNCIPPVPCNSTFELIQRNKVEKFLILDLSKEVFDGPNEELSSCTLLQLCCAKGLTSCVAHLLNQGASPNKTITKDPNSPIMIAMKEDHEDIVKLLLENPDLRLPEDILIKLQIKYKNLKNFAKIDKYMEIILKHLRNIEKTKLSDYLLAKDDLNRTALHYATHYRSSQNVLDLLSMGAPLTEKDIFGYSPLNSIEPNVLEKFFDNCIRAPKDAEDMNNWFFSLRNQKEKFSIEIDYEALISRHQTENGHESEILHQLIKIKDLTHLMNHPVISSYLAVKWQNFKWAVYGNLFLYLIAYISLVFYEFGYNQYSTISNGLLLAALLLLGIREFVQILIFRFDYIKRVDNIIDLFLIAGIIYIVAFGWNNPVLDYNLRVAFSVVFLTSTLGIFMQLGNLPFFTIKVIILRQISISFCKYMVFYVFPVLAFFFCFFMLREVTNEDFDVAFFQVLYDVVTMFAGDPDSSYPTQFTSNPIFSHIIYVCFIILIGIILQNLLIGLAVSDLQEIQKEAQFIDKKERANYITNIERVLFGKFKNSSVWFFKATFRKLLTMSSVFQSDRILVIQPYNFGCVFVKDNPNKMQYIRDQTIINLLQNVFKDFWLHGDNEVEQPYSLKVLHDRLQKVESLLEKLSLNLSNQSAI
jgi:ankyrin repeat protein